MEKLHAHFHLVDPEWLRQKLAERSFRLVHESRRPLFGGKGFWLAVFARG